MQKNAKTCIDITCLLLLSSVGNLNKERSHKMDSFKTHKGEIKYLTLAEKIERYRNAENKVKEHALCLKLVIEPHYLVVYLPHTIRGIEIMRIKKAGQKALALERLYLKLEKYWRLDNEVLYPNEKV